MSSKGKRCAGKDVIDTGGPRARGSGRVRRTTVPRTCLAGQLPNRSSTLRRRLCFLTTYHYHHHPPPLSLPSPSPPP
jgi:hypothetical protein